MDRQGGVQLIGIDERLTRGSMHVLYSQEGITGGGDLDNLNAKIFRNIPQRSLVRLQNSNI